MSKTITITKRYVAPDASVKGVYVSTPTTGNAVSNTTANLPVATTTTLGGVIVSSGLTITPDGYLSVSGGSIEIIGTPVDNQVTVWKGSKSIEGTPGLTFSDDGKLYVSSGITTLGGVHVGGTSDPGTDNLLVDGNADISGKASILNGLHIGGTSDAGVDNLLVDGNADISGRASVLNGLHVGGTSDPGIDNLLVDGTISNSLQYNIGTFTSGFFGAGHRLRYENGISSLELDDLVVRRKLSAYELEIREISSIGGSLVISVGNCVVYDIQGSNYIVDTDNNRNPIQFANGDIVRAQIWTGRGTDSWIGRVTSVVQGTTLGSAYFTADTLSGDNLWKGAKCVVVGSSNNSRNNIIYLTASDSDNPYISVLSSVTGATFAGHERLRMGSLAGVLDPAFGSLSGQYGLYADNVYLKGRIQISSGSGYGNLTDKPTSLSGINGTEGTKLSGIEAGATVGANWSTNVANKPTTLAGINSAEGTKLSGIEAGATVGANWLTNVTNKPTLGSLAALNTADWSTNVSGKPGYTGPASGRGLFMNDSYFGYYNYTDYPSDPWRAYISSDGTARFVNVTEFGTQPSAGWQGYVTNVAVKGPNIYEPQYNGTSALNINMVGYQGSTGQYRQLQVGDGRGTTAVMFNSRTNWNGYVYGTTSFYQDVSMTDGCYIGGHFRQGDHVKNPYASLATEHGINIGSGNETSRFQGTVDFYGYNQYFSYAERVMSINADNMVINKPLTITSSSSISSSAPTVNFGGGHAQAVGTTDITPTASEADMANMSLNITPKGNKIMCMFSAPFTVSTAGWEGLYLYLFVNGGYARNHIVSFYDGENSVSFHHIADVTPGVTVNVKMRWVGSGSGHLRQLGATCSERILSVIDLF